MTDLNDEELNELEICEQEFERGRESSVDMRLKRSWSDSADKRLAQARAYHAKRSKKEFNPIKELFDERHG